ncbi:hypothetical protein ACFXPX_35865 [Kitasatospora sp. NPDC059146]|uniref:hypothetical protein n=1 Tax=Kitasatospora sp. NPDC059146 TaxID=3346741 RepID=UPI0036BF8B4E
MRKAAVGSDLAELPGPDGGFTGCVKKTKNRSEFLEFCRHPRSLHPLDMRISSPSA